MEDTGSISVEQRPQRIACGIPMRYVFTAISLAAFVLVYSHQVVFSVAIVAMVNSSMAGGAEVGSECRVTGGNATTNATAETDVFNWDVQQRNALLSAFFWGNVITQIPGGRLAEKFGGKWIFGFNILISALMSLLAPLAARIGYGAFFAVRVVLGLAEGVAFPVMHCLIAKWCPKSERSTLATIIYSGTPLGMVITYPIAGFIIDSTSWGGWSTAFYLFGGLGVLCFIAWTVFVYNCPEEHPFISQKELDYFRQENEVSHGVVPLPWKAIATSVPFWALTVVHIGQNWGYLTLLTEMPTYLSNILHFDMRSNGIWSSLPYLVAAILANIGGFVCDLLRNRGILTTSALRKIANTIAFFVPAACLIGVTFVGCDGMATVILLTVALGVNGLVICGFQVTHVDMAPDFAGTLMGITNCISTMTGIVAPLVVGYFTKDGETLHQWSYVFYIASGFYVVTAVVFVIFGSASLQKWGVARTAVAETDESRLIS